MTDDLVTRLRDGKLTWGDRWEAADRIASDAATIARLEEALEAERALLGVAMQIVRGIEDALDADHIRAMRGKGRDPAKYTSEHSLARDRLRAVIAAAKEGA